MPWSYLRTTDHRYAIKVWAQEGSSLDWRVSLENDAKADHFQRLKALGFGDLATLKYYLTELAAAVAIHGDDIDPVLRVMSVAPPPAGFEPTLDNLVRGSHASIFHGLRHGPNGDRIMFVANMEGAPREIEATALAGSSGERWEPALASPGLGTMEPGRPVVLSDGEGLVFLNRGDGT